MELIEHPRYEDYDIKYKSGNRWAFLGNGFSTRDYDGRDITWFWGLVNGEDKLKEYPLTWTETASTDVQHKPSQNADGVRENIISPNAL